MGENLLTLQALAERWGIAEDVLFDLAQEGEVRSVQRGWDRFYPESALAEYVESKGLAINEYTDED